MDEFYVEWVVLQHESKMFQVMIFKDEKIIWNRCQETFIPQIR